MYLACLLVFCSSTCLCLWLWNNARSNVVVANTTLYRFANRCLVTPPWNRKSGTVPQEHPINL